MRQLKIITTGQAVFHLRAAGLATRAAAWLLDQAFLMVIRAGLLYSAAALGYWGVRYALPLLGLLEIAYFTWFEWRGDGRTPGKRRLRIRVARIDGGRLDFQSALLRNFLRLVDSLPLAMLVGGVAAWLEPLGRRLGDMAAGTMVVREREGSFSLPPADRERPNSFQENPALRRRIIARAGREDRDLALELMWRRDDLRPEAREELFRLLAESFRSRFALPEDESLSDEQTVLGVALILAPREE